MSRWDVAIPILVAVIAVAGGIIPILITNSYFREKPDLNAQITPPFGFGKVSLTIGNTGAAPATNLSIILHSPVNIKNITNFSPTEVLLKRIHVTLKDGDSKVVNNTSLELYVPRLVQGSGSVIELRMILEQSISGPSQGINLSLIYDQGSIGLKTGYSTGFSTFAEKINEYTKYYTGLYSIIVLSLVGFFVYYFVKKLRKRFLPRLIDDLLEIRRKLDSDTMTKDLLIFNPLGRKKLRKKFHNVKDFMTIDDLYRKVSYRNDNINTEKLGKLNHECLDLVNKALNIEWDKYK